LPSHTAEGLQRNLSTMAAAYERAGLVINTKKSEILIRGVATGVDIGIYTPAPPQKKKINPSKLFMGKNDVRTAIQQF